MLTTEACKTLRVPLKDKVKAEAMGQLKRQRVTGAAVALQSQALAEAASDDTTANGNAAVAQAGNTASNPPNLTSTASQPPSANGLTPQGEEAIPKGQTIPSITSGAAPLKGVPALPECRVKLTWQDDADKARQIRQAESAHPTKAEEEWRDSEGLYSPEQPFWGAVSDARALTSADCERQVCHTLL